MKKHYSLWLLVVLGCLLLTSAALTSCAPDKTAPELKATRTSAPQEPSEQVATLASNAGAAIPTVAFTDTACLNCHSNQDILKAMTAGQVVPSPAGTGWGLATTSVERWQQLWIDPEQYSGDTHALINCTTCHGGQAVGDPKAAHIDLIADPSANPEATCGTCHTDIAPSAAKSLHYTQAGLKTALHTRSSASHFDILDQIVSDNCPTCRATCGSCHVSQPGGAMLNGHAFVRTPPTDQTCLNCHGSMEGKEYYGMNEGVTADVHYSQAGMSCLDCHSENQMHGIGESASATSRYAGAPEPKCEDCHADQIGVGSGILLHELHGTEILPCQACHSVDYTNCTNCHVNQDSTYTLESSSVGFYLARNLDRSTDRPWRYVPVQHVPVDVNTFGQFGSDLLDQFLNRPTWVYTTPHNIQRLTPQTRMCNSCHSNNDLFLTVDHLSEAERGGANLEVIVETAPPLPDNWIQVMSQIAQGGAAVVMPSGEDTGTNFWASPIPTGISGGASYWTGGTNTPLPPTATPEAISTNTPLPPSTATPEAVSTEASADEKAEESESAPTSTPLPPTPAATSEESTTSFWAGTSTPTSTSSGTFWGQ